MELRPYQTRSVDEIAALAGRGVRRICLQAPTGSGKTITFSALTQRFLSAINRRVVIAVHRDKLLRQTVEKLQTVAGIKAGMLIADSKVVCQEVAAGVYIPHSTAMVVVCMVETLNNRMKRYEGVLGDVGMLIVDECHIGNFRKIYDHFPKALIVGFSATPISAKKKFPLILDFDEIVCPTTIKELIKNKWLAKNITITVKNGINRKALRVSRGDFEMRIMSDIYSSPKHVKNTVQAYEQYALGQKTLIFNCNIEHSKKVTEEFVSRGYNCYHIDGYATDDEKREALDWLERTHDAILCSVDLLTTGIDVPSIENIIVNRSTMSLPLWLQMCGRGSRVDGEMDHFKIIDMGANVTSHMDWDYPHDWKYYFHHPEKVGNGKGVAPTKLCPECEALIHLSCRICPFCGEDISKEQQYDTEDVELEVITRGVDVQKIIKKTQENDYKSYASLHIIKGQLVRKFRAQYQGNALAQVVREQINERYQVLVREWCKANKKPYDKWHKTTTRQWMMDELNRTYGKLETMSNP